MPRSLTKAATPQSQNHILSAGNRAIKTMQEKMRGEQFHHIMIISNRMELVESLQLEMTQAGYQVSVIHDGLRGLLAAQRVEPDLIITSWSPPRLSGLEICDRLRAHSKRRSVILITENDSPAERIIGFRKGASDCISMPCNMKEFMARVRCNLPQKTTTETTEESIVRCADLTLNRSTREVFREDVFIYLTAKEFDLLNFLMNNYFRVVTRAQVIEQVWGYDYCGSSNIVEVYIRYLRRKLAASGSRKLIHTVRGVGYILREPHSNTAATQTSASQPAKDVVNTSVKSGVA